MKSLWNEKEADACKESDGELGLRAYSSRLLGADESLVLAGGGNTSVKLSEPNVLGEDVELLYVKGSGWDLSEIEPPGFAGVRMDHCLRLLELPELTDAVMLNELKTHCTLASAPTPSVETLLHACLPFTYVDHTHADAVVTLTNLADGEARVRDVYADRVLYVPYVMPGYDLAKYCADLWVREGRGDLEGIVLLKHGMFSFGQDARESYERMISLVNQAEDYLRTQGVWELSLPSKESPPHLDAPSLAALRQSLSTVAGFPMLLRANRSPRALAFARNKQWTDAHKRGTATPDHVIRVKRSPLLGRDVTAYAESYGESFSRNAEKVAGGERLAMLDPAPRLVLDPELGLLSAGRRPSDCAVAEAIALHTFDIVERTEALGGYEPVGELDLFRMEYWELEQAKLSKLGTPLVFAGEVALVTGSASGIGRACVNSLRSRGCAVVGIDLDSAEPAIDYLPIVGDLVDSEFVEDSIAKAVEAFGGLDILVLNAGLFPPTQRLEELDDETWSKTMALNLDANQRLLRLCHPFLKLSPIGGRVLVVGSKNVLAPGPGAAAYSASKAAMTQVARVAALEWAASGIRVNVLHPNSVFDTNLWTPEILEKRAQAYGMTVEEYKCRNLLKTEVSSHDVAEAACELCGPRFSKTTGAQVPIDGGEERVV
ncbi:bifunctional aldolase/short-chain dehydrogenase [Opitutales bacterium]|nr:bifunctional aldolase/short-chain dehydrogenase [Opitutales bacterium]